MDRFFASEELKRSQPLRIVFWALWAGFIPAFYVWSRSDAVTLGAVLAGTHVCVPLFPGCGDYYFLRGLPHSYDQLVFFGGLWALLAASAVGAWLGRWAFSLSCLAVLFAFKLFYVFVATYTVPPTLEYFHLPPLFVLLFLSDKLRRIRVVVAVTYFLSVIPKLSPAWLSGAYFLQLKDGLPLVPDALIVTASRLVIVFELVTPWFLLSARRPLRMTAVALWTAFHLYSVLIVGWRFPLQCLPLLWAAFATGGEARPFRFSWRAPRLHTAPLLMAGYLAICVLPALLLRERDYTLRARKLGLNMIDANRQCVIESFVDFRDGSSWAQKVTSTRSSARCEPYTAWFRLRSRCGRREVTAIRLNLDVSINGGPFYRLVENVNVCEVEYAAFRDNPWIRTPSEGARVTGYPEKNSYN